MKTTPKSRFKRFFGLIAGLAVLCSSTALARGPAANSEWGLGSFRSHERPVAINAGGHGQDRESYQVAFVPLETIIANVQSSVPGRLVGVKGPQINGDRAIYRIIWETPDGRVITFIVDAHTGQILGR